MVALMATDDKKLPNSNFAMPPEIANEFRRIGDTQGERNKLRWAVAAAAVLCLLELPESEIYALIQRVAGARHFPKELEKMVAEAKAKAAEAERSLELAQKGSVVPTPRLQRREGPAPATERSGGRRS